MRNQLSRSATNRAVDKQIVILALPTLATILAEPAFLIADTAFVGHLGAAPLAGLAAASTVVGTIIGVCVFLAYGTTARVSRSIGAGNTTQGVRAGIDGMWLALTLGAAMAIALALTAVVWVDLLQTPDAAAPFAVTYLRWSAPGLPGMLIVLAATGILRGLLDTKTPLLVATAGALFNIAANYVLIYPAGLGVAGSAIGTSITQNLMALTLILIVAKKARAVGARLTPTISGLTATTRIGVPLVVRSLAMRVAIVGTTAVAAGLGTDNLAAHQVVMTLWNTCAFALDALAIAGQALTGQALGAGKRDDARHAASRIVLWSMVSGATVLGALVLARDQVAGLFTPDAGVIAAAGVALLVAGLGQVVAGYVFAWDGVLIGAGDAAYLARASVFTTCCYLPMLLAVAASAPSTPAGLAWLWAAYAFGFMGVRAATLWGRARGDAWAVVGD